MEKFTIILLIISAVTFVECKFGDGHGPPMFSCCDQPKVIPEATFSKCADAFGKHDGPHGGSHGGPHGGPGGPGGHGPRGDKNRTSTDPPPIRGCCMAECAFNETGLYKGNGVVDKAATKKLFASSTTEVEWKTVIQTAVDECFTTAAAKMDDFNNYMENGGSNNDNADDDSEDNPDDNDKQLCHPITGYIMKCVFGNMFINCPSDKFSDTDECNNLKERIEQCPDCGPRFG